MATRFIIILCLLGLAEFYSYILVRSIVKDLSPAWRTGITIAYVTFTLVCWLGFVFIRQLQSSSTPHLLRNIYTAVALGMLVAKILVLLVMLIDDLRRLITSLIAAVAFHNSPTSEGISQPIERSAFLKNTAIVLAGLTLGGFTLGIRNRYNYRVRKIKLSFANLPAAFKGMKIVQISDIHTGSFDNHAAVAHGIERVMDQKADIILFTGDLVNNVSTEVDEKYHEIFSRLKAPMGVYSTLGNHDYGDYVQWPTPEAKVANLDTLKQIHASMGWKLMMNEHVVFERGADKIALVGIENWGAKANFPKYGDMTKAYAGLKEKNVPFKILMSHDPSHWEAQVRKEYKDVDLTLSGHTHGMQFGIDSKIFKWSPVQYIYKQWAGIYQEDNQYLYVNRGFGFLGYPGRLGILPEITVIELA
ncbi:metallophosphatase [Flavipsychrobacter stenotrophus]|uniref:Metallophosphatase n=1 Tax=Flavipsychrobacter stenotrophus TaxID=2077091 RepID=A0A2S7SXT9_9BACT|nr:metallophosphoesterase [Flavipsychrobacter stenotrophus]PQJ11427.1 metallophosphatase [Flavipsychrobacter stenotrophus]